MTVQVFFLALGAAALFGLALVLTERGLVHLDPLSGACISVPTACAVFLLLTPVTIDWSGWSMTGVGIFALIGCLFPAAVTLLAFAANRRIGANLTGALGNMTPLFAVLLGIFLLGEVPDLVNLAGIVLIVGGVVMLYRTPRLGRLQHAGWAFALPIAAAAIRGFVQPIVKIGLAYWPNPFAAVTVGYMVSVVVILGIATVRRGHAPVSWNAAGWPWFAGVGLSNGFAVLAMYLALAEGSVTVVAPLVACYPLATLAFGWLLLGRASVAIRTAIGIALTVIGVGVLLVD